MSKTVLRSQSNLIRTESEPSLNVICETMQPGVYAFPIGDLYSTNILRLGKDNRIKDFSIESRSQTGSTVWLGIEASRGMVDYKYLCTRQDEPNSFQVGIDTIITDLNSSQATAKRGRRLLARIMGSNEITREIAIADGKIIIDPSTTTVTVNGSPVHFSPTEYAVLIALGTRIDQVASVEDVADQVWPYLDMKHAVDNYRTAKTAIHKKIGDELGNRETGAFRTLRKVGVLTVSSLLK